MKHVSKQKQESKQEKKKETAGKRPNAPTKPAEEVREMKIVWPEEDIKELKAIVKIDFKRNNIYLLETEVDIEDRQKKLLAERIVSKIAPALQKEFPSIVEHILSGKERDWLVKIEKMVDEGAEVTMAETEGRCVWIEFKKGKSVRSLLIE